jgi:lipopolysaccharide export system permease protein
MKILSRYLIKEFLLHLVFCLCVYLFVLLVVKVLKELVMKLITWHLGLDVIVAFMGLTAPFMLQYAMPLAILTASVLTFSKLSADNELVAAQSSGVSVRRLALPVILVVTILCGWAVYSNAEMSPQGLRAARQLVGEALLDKLESDPSVLFEPGKEIRDFPGYVVTVGEKDPQTGRLRDMRLTVLDKSCGIHSTYWAEQAEIKVRRQDRKIGVRLFKVGGVIHEPTLRPGVSGEDYSIEFELKDYFGRMGRSVKWTDRTFSDLLASRRAMLQWGERTTAITLEMNSRLSFAVACLAFALVGMPLGIKTHRRESSIGVLISILVAVGYYGFVVLAQALKDKSDILPVLMLWVPNALCCVGGVWLLWRAAKA